jgi:hypothetical protein
VRLRDDDRKQYDKLMDDRRRSMLEADVLRTTTTADGVKRLHRAVDKRYNDEREADVELRDTDRPANIDIERHVKKQRAKRRRSTTQHMINRLESLAALGGQPIYLRGDWRGRRSARGSRGGGRLGVSFDEALDRRQLVLVVDERFTSKRCCFCANDIRHATADDVGVSTIFEKGFGW